MNDLFRDAALRRGQPWSRSGLRMKLGPRTMRDAFLASPVPVGLVNDTAVTFEKFYRLNFKVSVAWTAPSQFSPELRLPF